MPEGFARWKVTLSVHTSFLFFNIIYLIIVQNKIILWYFTLMLTLYCWSFTLIKDSTIAAHKQFTTGVASETLFECQLISFCVRLSVSGRWTKYVHF